MSVSLIDENQVSTVRYPSQVLNQVSLRSFRPKENQATNLEGSLPLVSHHKTHVNTVAKVH